jgi:hypothetical protein
MAIIMLPIVNVEHTVKTLRREKLFYHTPLIVLLSDDAIRCAVAEV